MKLSWLLLLLPSMCLAEGLPVLPSINEAPLFWGLVGNDPRYHDAAFKAQEAFFIQSGVTGAYNMVTGYVGDRVNRVGKVVESKVATVIDDDTPLNSKHVFFVVGMGYTVAVKKEITQGFRDPFFKNVSHTITVGRDKQVFGVQIPF